MASLKDGRTGAARRSTSPLALPFAVHDDDDLCLETESSDALSLESAESSAARGGVERIRRPSNPHHREAGTLMTRELGCRGAHLCARAPAALLPRPRAAPAAAQRAGLRARAASHPRQGAAPPIHLALSPSA